LPQTQSGLEDLGVVGEVEAVVEEEGEGEYWVLLHTLK